MKRFVFAPPLLAIALAACGVDNDISLDILSNQVLERSTGCSVMMMATATAVRSEGVLDVGVLASATSQGYLLYPVVRNNLAMRSGGTTAGGIDTVTVQGADIELVPDRSIAPALPPSQRKYSVKAFGGAIEPSQMLGMSVEAVPIRILQMIAPVFNGTNQSSVVVRLRVTGTRAGGSIASGWIEYPVRLCRWCLTGGAPRSCAKPFKTSEVNLGSCNYAQDTPVTCCFDEIANNKLLCGKEVPQTAM